MLFEEKRIQQFEEDLGNYTSLRRRIERRIADILKAPYERSHTLGKGKWKDLTGKRGADFAGGHMVFILAICEACIQNGWQVNNLPECGDICDNQPLKRVVWIAFGLHDGAYGKK